MSAGEWGFETKQVHAGASPQPGSGALALPIFQTTAYAFPDAGTAAALFAKERAGFIYSRGTNPTVAAVERRLAALDGGSDAVLVSSGQAATAAVALTLAERGDEIVASSQLYGGTATLLGRNLAKRGIATRFIVDSSDPDAWRAAVGPHTRALFTETISNPSGQIADLETLAEIAHAAGVPLVVDNTLATPAVLRPLEWGADIVVYSASKFLSGHGTVIAGAVIDGGSFDYGAHADRFPEFSAPEPGFDDLVVSRDFGAGGRLGPQGKNAALAGKIRLEQIHDFGPTPAPFTAFLLEQGLETLSLRLERHVANAQAVARWLDGHPGVNRVFYAGLPSSPWAELALKYTPAGPGAVVSFEVPGGVETVQRFLSALRLISIVANIGDVRTLAIHPYTTTHGSTSPEERAAAGVTEGLIRLSVGLETLADLEADLETAFAAIDYPAL